MLVSKQVLDYLATLLATSDEFSLIDPEVAYSEDESGTKPIVELHISGGDFSDKGSATLGDKTHSFTIQVTVIASSAAKYDLAVLEAPGSTDEQRATALEQGQRAANNAYAISFHVFGLVFDIINNRANYDFGLPKYTLKRKEFGKYKMSRHVTNGNLATVFSEANIDVTVNETVEGVDPVVTEEPPVSGIIDGSLPD